MSDKLVVEFYDPADSALPCACILACYGGDSPASAAVTLLDFMDALTEQHVVYSPDVYSLAARFVVWESQKRVKSSLLDFDDVTLIPFSSHYGYQVIRVYAHDVRPYIYCVRDEWTTDQELLDAAVILGQSDVGPPNLALTTK